MPEASHTRLIMLGTAFSTRGGIASVVNTYRAEGLFERWPIDYIPTHCDGGALRKLLTAIKALFTFVALLTVSRRVVMHVHVASHASFWRKSIYMAVGTLVKCPLILHLHGGGFERFYESECGAFGRWVIRFFLDRAACFIVVSDRWKNWVGKITHNPMIVCIPNLVSRVADAAMADRQRIVLFLGRLESGKGIHDLLEAIFVLRSAIPDVRLVCAGDGDIAAVARHVKRLGIGDAVSFPGWVGPAERQGLMNIAAAFVLPSHAEGLPMSLLEAMAAGVPVIATAVGGVPDVVTDGVNGFTFAPGDTARLEQLLRRLLQQPELGAAVAMAARETIRMRYTADRVLVQLEKIYTDLGLARITGTTLPEQHGPDGKGSVSAS